MLAVARALMSNPRLLLLDEPSEGLAPLVVDLLMVAFEKLAAAGDMTILLVEQNVDVALAFAERALVLLDGQVAFDGKSAELKADTDRLNALVAVPTG
jgi:branched-chain amino acid transport system ATP-binding protein